MEIIMLKSQVINNDYKNNYILSYSLANVYTNYVCGFNDGLKAYCLNEYFIGLWIWHKAQPFDYYLVLIFILSTTLLYSAHFDFSIHIEWKLVIVELLH